VIAAPGGAHPISPGRVGSVRRKVLLVGVLEIGFDGYRLVTDEAHAVHWAATEDIRELVAAWGQGRGWREGEVDDWGWVIHVCVQQLSCVHPEGGGCGLWRPRPAYGLDSGAHFRYGG
jgi:hypothetical protein